MITSQLNLKTIFPKSHNPELNKQKKMDTWNFSTIFVLSLEGKKNNNFLSGDTNWKDWIIKLPRLNWMPASKTSYISHCEEQMGNRSV